jgi:hypothetical protein
VLSMVESVILVESVIYGSIYPFPFLPKSGSFPRPHLMTPRGIIQ